MISNTKHAVRSQLRPVPRHHRTAGSAPAKNKANGPNAASWPEIGLTVLKPYGDCSRYEVGIEYQGRLLRVQFKSSTFSRGQTYTCNLVNSTHTAYRPNAVDYFTIYLVPLDYWYIIPFEATR